MVVDSESIKNNKSLKHLQPIAYNCDNLLDLKICSNPVDWDSLVDNHYSVVLQGFH